LCSQKYARGTFPGQAVKLEPRKGHFMAHRTTIVLAAIAAIGVASFSSDAFAWRGGGVGRGGVGWHGGARGAYARPGWRPGVGVAVGVGAAAVGAAVAAPYYYNSAACGYYPYPACY
jgi:hypothetical protein